MKEIPDATGRFKSRPYYEGRELDLECESVITDFIKRLYGKMVFPIPTDALTKLIERDAADLDLFADLAIEGPDVEGVTTFFPDRKPKVRIAKQLSEGPGREHRLRTTLTHEYGHVKLHGYLWQIGIPAKDLFGKVPQAEAPKCKRDSILNASKTDWMEWQAGYACGALLMPLGEMRRLVDKYFVAEGLNGSISPTSAHSTNLQTLVSTQFQVSKEAARVRLSVLGTLSR